MKAPAVVCSRRVSAGIRTPAAGGLPSWWGAADWLREVEDALDADRLRAHHVSRDAVVKVAGVMAGFADHRTGRDCRPTNERLRELALCSLSTVQRARRLLKELGLVVELVAGRSMMSRAERLEAWRRGSSWRQIAAEFALCSRRRSAPRRQPETVREAPGSPGAPCANVDDDTPPGAGRVGRFSHLLRLSPRRGTETKSGAPRRAHTEKGGTGAGRRLAEDVGRRLRWLQSVSWRRTAPTLTRFARAGWTVRDVELAVRDALSSRGWRMPARLDHPAAYLALLLRELDPADRPSVLEDELDRLHAAERHFHNVLRVSGPPCAHGEPAGNVPSPLRGLLLCPACRLDASRAAADDGSRTIGQ